MINLHEFTQLEIASTLFGILSVMCLVDIVVERKLK